MFIVTNRLFVAADYAEEFERRFAERVSNMQQQPGFIRMQIHKSLGKETPWAVQTTWQSQADFKTWVGSEDFKEAHANPMPESAFTAPGRLEQHEVIVNSDK